MRRMTDYGTSLGVGAVVAKCSLRLRTGEFWTKHAQLQKERKKGITRIGAAIRH
jgi:hypothetical protein